MDWFAANGFGLREPVSTNEGEGDFLLVGDTIFAGTGFRSDAASHDELRRLFSGGGRKKGTADREVVTLKLIDPSFYHLDTAFAVLDSDGGPASVAFLPKAFDARSLDILDERFPEAIHVNDADAAVLGLNSFSDGRNVVIASPATHLHPQLPHPRLL